MRLVHLLIAQIVCVILLSEVSANCLCGATGEDYCSCKGFRPLPKLLDKLAGPAPKFSPIGDKCWCGKQLVEPAIPPKPCCPKKLPVVFTKPVCNTCGAMKSVHLGSPCPCSCQGFDFPLPYLSHKPKYPGLPADPVSVSIAYQMGNCRRCAVPEAKLQYGFLSTPLNGIKRVCSSNIPEEKLYALNRGIIELKKNVVKKEEDIIEEESEEDVGPDPAYLTYGELGYCPEKFQGAKFIGLPPAAPEIPSAVPSQPIGDCGFKPGSVVPFNQHDRKFHFGDCLEDV